MNEMIEKSALRHIGLNLVNTRETAYMVRIKRATNAFKQNNCLDLRRNYFTIRDLIRGGIFSRLLAFSIRSQYLRYCSFASVALPDPA